MVSTMESKLLTKDNKRELRMANPIYGGKYCIAESESRTWKSEQDSEDIRNKVNSGKDWVDIITSENFQKEFSDSSVRATLHHNTSYGILGRQQGYDLSPEYKNPNPTKKHVKYKGRIISTIIISCLVAVAAVVTVICILLNKTKNDKKLYEIVKAEGKISIQQAFTKELNNAASDTYLNFTREFVKETTTTLKHNGLTGLRNCTVTGVRNGSIIVEFDLFLETLISTLTTQTLKTAFNDSFVIKENGNVYFGKYHIISSSLSISIVLSSQISTTNKKTYNTTHIPSMNSTSTTVIFSDSSQSVVKSLNTEAHTIPYTNANVTTTATSKTMTPYTNTKILKSSWEPTTTTPYKATMLKTPNATTTATLTTTTSVLKTSNASTTTTFNKTTTILKTPNASSAETPNTTTAILKTSGVTTSTTPSTTTKTLKTANATPTAILKTSTLNTTTTILKTPNVTTTLNKPTTLLKTLSFSTNLRTTPTIFLTLNASTIPDTTTVILKTPNSPNASTLPNTSTMILKNSYAITVSDKTTTTLKPSITNTTTTLMTTSIPTETTIPSRLTIPTGLKISTATIPTTNSTLKSISLTSAATSNPRTTLDESPSIPEELSTNLELTTTKTSLSSKATIPKASATVTPTIISVFSHTITPRTSKTSSSTMTTSTPPSTTSLTITTSSAAKPAIFTAITTIPYSSTISASDSKTTTLGSPSPTITSSTVSTPTTPTTPKLPLTTFSTLPHIFSKSQSTKPSATASSASTSIPTTILTPPSPPQQRTPQLRTTHTV